MPLADACQWIHVNSTALHLVGYVLVLTEFSAGTPARSIFDVNPTPSLKIPCCVKKMRSSLIFFAFSSSSFASASGLNELSLSDPTSCSSTPGGPLDGPCGPTKQFCGPLFDSTSPQFHVRDQTCGENDPNFPLYDPLHKLYHHFWQAHLAEPANGVGRGPDIGHAVSADLVTWASLPVAVWNDQAYDNVAIYTGSATIVNGIPTMIYPGLCTTRDWKNCTTGTLLAIAVPADHAGDPLLTNWSKPSYNPIVEGTQRDPTTAWQTAAGEWRITNYEGGTYNSDDFITWTRASGVPIFGDGSECPDFFILPPPCQGKGCNIPWSGTGPKPTHVHKQSSGFKDWYTFGVYEDGIHGSQGNWTPSIGLPPLIALDASALVTGLSTTFYASKSFWDPVNNRRIYWGWALVPPSSTQTLPRVTEWHSGLSILTFNPLPELSNLRDPTPLFSSASLTIPSNSYQWLGDWAPGAGNQSELGASFVLPSATSPATSFGVHVLAGNSDGGGNSSMELLINFDPSTFTASITVNSGTAESYYMPNVDIPGGDYNVTNVDYTDPHICQAACTADGNKCLGFVYVTRPPKVGSCCLKSMITTLDTNPTCTSGVKHPKPPQGTPVNIPLLKDIDTAIDVRVFVDNTFIEVYIMEGRLAFTLKFNGGEKNVDKIAGMDIFNGKGGGSSIIAQNVNVWSMKSIWTDPPAVLSQAATKNM